MSNAAISMRGATSSLPLPAAKSPVRSRSVLAAVAFLIVVPAADAQLIDARIPVSKERTAMIARAQVWEPVNIAARDLRNGPQAADGFKPGETVTCAFEEAVFEGRSPKFQCRLSPTDALKVKFGVDNGEVYSEVAATRLLWALGFGADRMYPVRVICRGCPDNIGEPTGQPGERLVDPAAIERSASSGDTPPGFADWSWLELDEVDVTAGGAPLAHRDALKLLAAFLQHGDSKPEQQRLICRGRGSLEDGTCERPFLMLNDVGLTFGRANYVNLNAIGGANLDEWESVPVWKYSIGCVANLSKSFTGTLRDPVISEEGRRFLSGLLAKLSDRQLLELFTVARMDRRSGQGVDSESADEWVDAFERKRQEIADRRCAASWSEMTPLWLDTTPNRWLQSFASPTLTSAMNTVSALGYIRVFIALGVLVVFLHNVRAGATLLLLMALTAAITSSGKVAAAMPRPDAVDSRVRTLVEIPFTDAVAEPATPSPDDDDAFGFPSGHIAATTAFMLGLVFLVGWRRAWAAGAIVVLLMAVSRMYLGTHVLADVIGGIAVAAVATAFVVRLRLWRLETPDRARWTIRRVAALGAAAVILAVTTGVPPAYEAGRVAGFAAAIVILAATGRIMEKPLVYAAVRCVVLSALLFAATWWLTDAVLSELAAERTISGRLLAGGLPAFVLLCGPLYVDRWLTGIARVRRSAPAAADG